MFSICSSSLGCLCRGLTRLAEMVGFVGIYLTGSGISMSALGAPDVSLVSFGEVLNEVKRIADCVDLPIVADADTGYGGPLNPIRTCGRLCDPDRGSGMAQKMRSRGGSPRSHRRHQRLLVRACNRPNLSQGR
ncbi:isocitrate lyase/phosphoenolpyruvate mutase family protein [uncultured Paracoccus sp.]|uniref:isocitrate lyase/phosphoenolpyruvate mutase family protein n=1 Tax=uncultured Paracoccus sp. TaxID=189685 RepID=UPI0034180CA7